MMQEAFELHANVDYDQQETNTAEHHHQAMNVSLVSETLVPVVYVDPHEAEPVLPQGWQGSVVVQLSFAG
jgi:hypothetical protein